MIKFVLLEHFKVCVEFVEFTECNEEHTCLSLCTKKNNSSD